MKIGKTIKVVTSPKREVRKAGERVERPIPVKIPESVPVKAEEWRFMYGCYGAGLIDKSTLFITACS